MKRRSKTPPRTARLSKHAFFNCFNDKEKASARHIRTPFDRATDVSFFRQRCIMTLLVVFSDWCVVVDDWCRLDGPGVNGNRTGLEARLARWNESAGIGTDLD